MDKNELIAKQQLEIEELKIELDQKNAQISSAYNLANFVQQWSTKCEGFPKMAMTRCIQITRALKG